MRSHHPSDRFTPGQNRGLPSASRSKHSASPPLARSKRAVNLGRLADALGLDLLSEAVGVSRQALRLIIDGRPHAQEAQYFQHMAQSLERAGVPMSWLDQPFTNIPAPYLQTLRFMAAESTNKEPTRRANFKRLVKEFEDQLDVLADALEMVPSSVLNVAEGHLECDAQRYNHINPRLMKADFPDGWLEQPNPELTPSMVAALRELALEEEALVTADHADAVEAQNRATAPVQQTLFTTPSQNGSASLSKPQETTMPATDTTTGNTTGKPTTAEKSKKPRSDAEGSRRTLSGLGKLAKSTRSSGRPLTPGQEEPVASTKVEPGRPTALDNFFNIEGIRRGSKVTLWESLLGRKLQHWGNIRRGASTMSDKLAAAIEMYLELPTGWLDNPVFPPATMAAWLTDTSIPLPKSPADVNLPPYVHEEEPGKVSWTKAPAPPRLTPGAVKAKVKTAKPPKPRLPVPPAASAAPGATPASVAPATTAEALPAATASAAPVAAPVAAIAAVPAPAPAPSQAIAAAPQAPAEQSYGPLADVLFTKLKEKAREGKLSDPVVLDLLQRVVPL